MRIDAWHFKYALAYKAMAFLKSDDWGEDHRFSAPP
jgi:hypothetical protein